jgi:CBS domain-containing protein
MDRRLNEVLADKGTEIFSVPPGATVREAVRLMNQRGIGAVLVCEGQTLVGVFTERDVLRRILDAGRDPAVTLVAEVMTREVITVQDKLTVREALAVVTEKRCRHLPVLAQGKLVGVVSSGDLVRVLTLDQRHEIEELVDYITGRYPA